MKTTVNIFRTLLLAVLTLTFGSCSEDSLLSELGLDGQTTTRTDGVGEVWDGKTVAADFAGGSGTAEAPYLIANGAQLARFAAMVNGTLDGTQQNTAACGKLTADILLNNTEGWENWGSTAPAHTWTPIGNSSQPFTGTLDGDGHSVSGIYINSTEIYQGLVGYLDNGGTLQNLGVKASYIKGDGYVGGVCGMNMMGNVTNCYNTGSVTGSLYVGGVCGQNYGTVTNCYNTGNVTGNDAYVGGLCGQNYATVSNCYYLDTCGAAGEGTSKTAGEFASGEVAWLLQGEQAGQVWGQTIGREDYPVLGGLKVYNNNGTYSNMAMNSDFYLISTADELRLFASMVNGGQTNISAKLTADILLNDISNWESWNESTEGLNSWTPIGSSWDNFTGTLDGDGHSVSGIYINSEADNQGLVGVLGSGGALQNLGVKASYIKGGNAVGSVCGRNDGTVTNCYNAGNVKGSYTGGVCGWNMGDMTNCYNTGNVTGNVTGNDYVGGLCGENFATVTNCYNTGSVEGDYTVGGLCGQNYDGTVTNCYNTGNVTGNDAYVGGLCGQNYATVTNCYYLTGTAAGGIGYGSGDATEKNADQFQSGEVASLLGEGWGQTIGTDDYPVLTSDANKKVYAYTMYQGQSQSTETGYANNNGNVDLDLTSHPNTIAVFEASGTFSGKNIVVKDGNSYTCAELVLADGEDFYTPVAFTATKATYTRSPKVWATNDGSGSGWETICLPFSGTLYAGEEAKQPVDVASDNGAYWLRSLTDFESPNTLIFASPATAADNQIKAGVPYIIALPGTSFGSESLEGQTITVRGTNVAVTNAAESVQPEGSLFAFTGTFATKAGDALSYQLNSENGTDGAGNLFVFDTKALAPFRCRVDVIGLNIGGASRSASGLPKELRIGQ